MTNIDRPDFVQSVPSGGNQLLPFTTYNVPANSTVNTPVFYVGNQAAVVVGYEWQSGNALVVRPRFQQTPSGGVFNVNNSQDYGVSSFQQHFLTLPVMGPYFFIRLDNNTAAGGSITVSIFGVLAAASAADFFPGRLVINRQSVALAVTATDTATPNLSVPGRYHLWALGNQNMEAAVQVWTGNAWNVVAEINPAANVSGNLDFVAPGDDWEVLIQNQGAAAGTFYYAVTGPE